MNSSSSITKILFYISTLLLFVFINISAQEELLIKRETVFEFAKEPSITKKENQFTIEFETKSFCDVTIAVEDENGEILRHLACGVLGKRAPASFQSNSLKQSVIWDGKNDRGEYVKEFNNISIRVSLGLSPLYDKNLYWEPKRRQGREAPIMQATPEGVYVYDGGTGMDFVKLYSHSGEYIKTVYPFPGNKINEVKGLNMHTFPDGKTLPEKPTFLRQTLLTSGNDYGYENRKKYAFPEWPSAFGDAAFGRSANASSILAVNNGKIALGMKYLFRFATDGTSGGMDVEGPPVALTVPGGKNTKAVAVVPKSGCLSPDGKILYLTAYHYCLYGEASNDIVTSLVWKSFHCVLKMDLEGDKKPELFAGSLELDQYGKDDKSFCVPAHVTVDKEGRVYVSDYLNDRVQIFSPDGKLLKSISIISPSQVSIHAKTQEIYIFSSMIYTEGRSGGLERKIPAKNILTVFDEFPKVSKKQEYALPKEFTNFLSSGVYNGLGFPLSAIVDTDGTTTTIWMANELRRINFTLLNKEKDADIHSNNIKIFSLNEGVLVEKIDFEKDVLKKNISVVPPTHNRPRLYTNPKNKKLYVAECRINFNGKAFKEIKEIDPITGATNTIELPFDAEDMAFDQLGFAYLRSLTTVGRYDITANPWREIPWDYGMERNRVFTDTGSARKEAAVMSGLDLPGGGGWHHGGMYVSANGNLAVGCLNPLGKDLKDNPSKFKPAVYPGRALGGRGGTVAVHVFDKFGKSIYEDFVPGLANNTYGLGLDNENNLYLMASGTRVYEGKEYYRNESGTLMKFKPKKGKIISVGAGEIPVPLPIANYLKKSFDISDSSYGNAWVENAEWFFGGVGWSGKNSGIGCSCWNARMTFDYYNRSFAPEIDRYSVAVLDEEGNLILRVGQYGNADSQGAKSKAPLGGDEVGLTHGAYLGTLTDKYLFIADPANQNVISVKLNYAKTNKQKLPQ